MGNKLEISIGSYSHKGIKDDNDDCLAYRQPDGYILNNKGIVAAIATGKLFSKTILKGMSKPFVLELPPYQRPTGRSLLLHWLLLCAVKRSVKWSMQNHKP